MALVSNQRFALAETYLDPKGFSDDSVGRYPRASQGGSIGDGETINTPEFSKLMKPRSRT
jgi:hypothetical protein